MSDGAHTTADPTLADLARHIALCTARTDRVQQEAEALRHENARLSRQLAELTGEPPTGAAGGLPTDTVVIAHTSAEQPPPRVSRRGALRLLGGAAAGGVGLALGSAYLAADPAAASTGTMMFGAANNAGTSITSLSSNTAAGSVTFFAQNAATNGFGLYGVSISESGLVPPEGSAVVGDTSGDAVGVVGLSTGGTGVYGIASESTTLIGGGLDHSVLIPFAGSGVVGDDANGIGVTGLSSRYGVVGLAGPQSSIFPAIESAGVRGTSLAFVGVSGLSDLSYGVQAYGGQAPLYLAPGAVAGPPSTNAFEHQVGEIYDDANGALFICTGASTLVGPNEFSPGTWQRVTLAAPNYNGVDPGSIGAAGSINLLSSPIRVFDSRITGSANPANPSRPAGPTVLGTPITLKIANIAVGSISIPAGAVGVIGNVTVTIVSGGGWLTLYPAGAPKPTTSTPSTLNFQASDSALANACTVALGTSGSIDILAFQASSHVIFDVTGFIY